MTADKPIPLLEGRVLDLRKPWPLPPATAQEALQRAAEKAAPRRFSNEPLTGFNDLED